MNKTTVLSSVVAIFLIARLGWCGIPTTADRLQELESVISRTEDYVEEICQLAETGKLVGTRKLSFAEGRAGTEPVVLVFTKNSLDEDLNKAFAMLDKLDGRRKALELELAKPRIKQIPAAPKRPMSPEEAMRRAEKKTAAQSPDNMPDNVQVFDVFESYEQEHKQKQAQLDQMAEADMKRVAEERNQAEKELAAKLEAERKIQEQNREWQNELDNQADKAAQEELQWKREHGIGNFAKGLFRTVVGGAVTSATGGFASSVGGGMADIMVRKMFPDFTPSGQYERDTDQQQ